MKKIVEDVADRVVLNKQNIRKFLDEAFTEVSKRFDLENFQARATKMGEAFEECFALIIERLYPNSGFKLEKDVALHKACMIKRGGADFAVFHGDFGNRKLVAVIEAKGSADRIMYRGKRRKLLRPGMLRTDTVKKAICSAYQVKRAFKNVLFFIVTSHKPKAGNAGCMCNLAEGDIVDKIVDVTIPEELDEMMERIRAAVRSQS